MENPEEILHSLEEFAKMKPKDIPRELEEYLKFVAKTGDPIYQWSAIKSLFREKFINVITEFYESCSSMEIPPCPNVEMFNYDLMKSFILEKIDTFASAPFTLQRICELLTSPRKEYTRIDKYMRALEKNILVVSTMEPGGRRTENGEGIMNGIESDHEHVPEPGNEINVEEMDDSPYVQTTNHITERISFDNPKNNTHIEIENPVSSFTSEKIPSEASTSNQEIVCVQYVSIEPVVGNDTQDLIDEAKEGNVSVTITAVNIKDDNQAKTQIVESVEQQTESLLTESVPEPSSEAVMENIDKSDSDTDSNVNMETDSTETVEEKLKLENTEILTHTLAEGTPTTTIPDKVSEDLYQPHISLESDSSTENVDTENISPENSVSSSDNSCESSSESNASVEVQSSNLRTDIFGDSEKDFVANQEVPTTNKEDDNQNTDESDVVDSTTKAAGDNVKCEVSKQSENETSTIEVTMEGPLESSTKSDEEIPEVQSTENDNVEGNNTNDTSIKTDVLTLAVAELPETDETNDIAEDLKHRGLNMDKASVESKTEQVSSVSEEKETPMEVDAVAENTSDINSKEKSPIKEPESSEPPEKS